MTRPSTYDMNVAKIRELEPRVQWAGEQWLNECWNLNYKFQISEAFRTATRQAMLYSQGRTLPGEIVTWTRTSKHMLRLAVDAYPINCSFADIVDVAKKYGIVRPLNLVALGDVGHFEFDNAISKPDANIPKSESAALRRLEREAAEAKSPRRERLLARKDLLNGVK